MDGLGAASLTAREAMVASQLRPAGVNMPALLAAVLEVPRERFVPPERAGVAYADRPVELGGGRELNSPEVVGLLLNALVPQPGERALVVGAGTGYSAAVLVRMGCRVIALDQDAELAAKASNVLGVAAVEFATGPLAQGHSAGAPYDLVLIDGAVPLIPDALVEQLAPGGRLAAVLAEEGATRLVLGRRTGDAFGVQAFADGTAAALPGFARPRAFTF